METKKTTKRKSMSLKVETPEERRVLEEALDQYVKNTQSWIAHTRKHSPKFPLEHYEERVTLAKRFVKQLRGDTGP